MAARKTTKVSESNVMARRPVSSLSLAYAGASAWFVVVGGRAPNVIPDYAIANLLIRLVGPTEELRREITAAVAGKAEANFILEIPFMELGTVPGIDTMVAAFTTDIPALKNWGKPVLIGPGSIHVAHTEGEYIAKQQLLDAVDLYARIARHLLAGS